MLLDILDFKLSPYIHCVKLLVITDPIMFVKYHIFKITCRFHYVYLYSWNSSQWPNGLASLV